MYTPLCGLRFRPARLHETRWLCALLYRSSDRVLLHQLVLQKECTMYWGGHERTYELVAAVGSVAVCARAESSTRVIVAFSCTRESTMKS